MSLAINATFPAIDALSIIVGSVYTELTSFIIQRPVFGAIWQKAQLAQHPKEAVESKQAQGALFSLFTSAASSLVRSYGVNALLRLANAASFKSAAIVGTVLFAVESGPQLIQGIFVAKQTFDVVASNIIVNLLNTIGLSLFLEAHALNQQ